MSRLKETDDFGNRMKAYEAVETARALDPLLPIYARIDGRSFSRFTRGMEKPFDARLGQAMIETTKHLVAHTHARTGYTQSDEISLIWLAEGETSDVIFSGKLQKLTSILASLAAAKFMSLCPPEWASRLPHFDCRVIQMPNTIEGANVFLWRAMDAQKNAISMVAQSLFSPKRLHGVDQKGMLQMIAEAGVDFDQYPVSARRGTFVQRRVVNRELSPDELARIPEAHRPIGPVMRTIVVELDMPKFNKVRNRVEVIFDGSPPVPT